MITRRRFLLAAAAATGTPLATILYTGRIEPHWLDVTQHDLPIRGLPPSLEGATLAQLSDLHIGIEVDADYILRTFQRVAALEPDVVVVTPRGTDLPASARLR